MSRPLVVTKIATSEDLPVLLALWDELRQVGGRAERAVNPITAVDVRDRLGEVLLDPQCRVVLACAADQPVGMAILCVVRPDPLSEGRIVQIAHLVVSRGQRHRGVGHALVSAAADFATERHIDHVTASAYSSFEMSTASLLGLALRRSRCAGSRRSRSSGAGWHRRPQLVVD